MGDLNTTPPHSSDIERTILGLCMIDSDGLSYACENITEEMFYKPPHRIIFSVLKYFFVKNIEVDQLLILEELKKRKRLEQVGGESTVMAIMSDVIIGFGSAANIDTHCKVLGEKYKHRQIITMCNSISQESYDGNKPARDVINDVNLMLDKINGEEDKKGFQTLNGMVNQAYNEILESNESKTIAGIPTGFPTLDKYTNGWQKGDTIIIGAAKKAGKCFGKGTQVLMHDGSIKNIENINIEDMVMGINSIPQKVLNLSRGREKMYRITLKRNGDSFVCNSSHILSLRKTGNVNQSKHKGRITSTRYSKGEIVNITVGDYLKKSKTFKIIHHIYKKGVEFNKQNVPLDPYFLGLWLGDGTSRSVGITTKDKEIVGYLYKLSTELGLKITVQGQENSKASSYSLVRKKNKKPKRKYNKASYGKEKPLTLHLRELNLICNKHIPQIYKINTRENRLKLLAGLIDSDGYSGGKSGVVFCNKNRRLIDDVAFLSKSLGFATSITSTINKKYRRIYYRINIYGDFTELPLLLKYKLPKYIKAIKEPLNYSFTVEDLGEDNYYGFWIDGDGLFLLSDFTVVHNSVLGAIFASEAASRGYPVGIFTLEMSTVSLIKRFIASKARVNTSEVHYKKLNDDDLIKLSDACNIFYNNYSTIVFDDNASTNIIDMTVKAKRMKKLYDIKLLIVDYLQLMPSVGKESRQREIEIVSHGLKAIAKTLNIPVIIISQLSRPQKGNEKKAPMLTDLRDSSALEADASVVVLLYEPDLKRKEMLVNARNCYWDEKDDQYKRIRELIIAANREGQTSSIPLIFYGEHNVFYELENK